MSQAMSKGVDMDIERAVLDCAELMDQRKAMDTVVLDIRGLSGLADYFIIASGENARHASALADYAEEKLFELGYELHHREGNGEQDWVVLDYMDFIVHVFSKDKRNFYKLDALWSKAPVIYDTRELLVRE